MKKVAYDKSGIMKEAWNLFNNDDITLADFEHLGQGMWIESGESSLPNGPYPSTHYGRRANPSITLSAYALAGGRKLR